MSEKFFSDAIYLFMCLSQVVSCTLSCIPTVQSYDKVSVPARGFRPGAASFPTWRAIWPSPSCVRARRRIAVDAGHPLFKGL